MKELTKTIRTELTITKKEVQHILQNPPAFLDQYDDVYDVVLAQVVKSINHLGWALPGDDDLQILVDEITNSIQTNHKPLRKEEISMCFYRGIRGEYGEFYGINVVTFDKFIAAYLLSDYRANVGKTLPVAALPAPSKELTRQDRIDFAQKAYESYKISGFYNDLGNIVYTFLDSEHLIPFTTSEKFEMLEQARAEEYKRLQNPLSVEEARRFNIQIEALMASNDKIIPQSKRIALNKYFEQIFTLKLEIIPFK